MSMDVLSEPSSNGTMGVNIFPDSAIPYLKQFEYINTIADCGGITQAAEKLHIAQPALSRYLKKIETSLGVELFDRSTLPIRLTAAGEQYLEAGVQMIDVANQLEKRITEIKKAGNTCVRVGISPSRTAYLLPEVISVFRSETNGNIAVNIIEKDIISLNTLLMKGEADIIFSFLDDNTANYARIELYNEELFLAVPKKLAELHSESITDLLNSETLVLLPESTRTGSLFCRILKKNHIQPNSALFCTTIESALAMVRAGVGITVVPSYIVYFGFSQEVEFLPLLTDAYPELMTTKYCLFYRKKRFLSKADKTFIDITNRVINRSKPDVQIIPKT